MDQKITRSNITKLSVDLVNLIFEFLKYRSEAESYSMINKSARGVYKLTTCGHWHKTLDQFSKNKAKEVLKEGYDIVKCNNGFNACVAFAPPFCLSLIKNHIMNNGNLYSNALAALGTSYMECKILEFKNISYKKLLTHKALTRIYRDSNLLNRRLITIELFTYIEFMKMEDNEENPTVILNTEKMRNDLISYVINTNTSCPLVNYYMGDGGDESTAIIQAVKFILTIEFDGPQRFTKTG